MNEVIEGEIPVLSQCTDDESSMEGIHAICAVPIDKEHVGLYATNRCLVVGVATKGTLTQRWLIDRGLFIKATLQRIFRDGVKWFSPFKTYGTSHDDEHFPNVTTVFERDCEDHVWLTINASYLSKIAQALDEEELTIGLKIEGGKIANSPAKVMVNDLYDDFPKMALVSLCERDESSDEKDQKRWSSNYDQLIEPAKKYWPNATGETSEELSTRNS